jgi:rod shape determining protein RodA
MYGATRWLGLGGSRLIQPSELMKIAMILAIAFMLGKPTVNSARIRYVVYTIILMIIPAILILMEPDLGTAIVLLPVVFAMVFSSGTPIKPLLKLIVLGILLLSFLLALVLVPERLNWDDATKERLIKPFGLKMYHRNRIMVFFDNEADPLGSGWSKRQSQIAVGSGQLWGKGYGKGTQNILGFLPKTVAPTDFIFSVIAEESGFAGSATVLALFAILIWRGMMTATKTADKSARLLCVGLIAMLFCHIFVNISMTIGLLPTTGIPLPLISYGGTFMTGVMSTLGIIQSIHMRIPRI